MAAAAEGDLQLQQEIAAVFASAGSSSNEVQQQVAAALGRINAIPKVYVHYAAILGNCQYTPDVRQVAGLSLKTALQRQQQLQQQELQQVLSPLLHALQEEERSIRAAAGSAITSLICCQQLSQQQLQELLQQLLLLLDSHQFGIAEGALITLSKVTEDMLQGVRLQQMELQQQQQQQLLVFIQWAEQQLLPRLLQEATPAAAAAAAAATGLRTPEQQQLLQQQAVYTLNLFSAAQAFSPGGPFYSFFPQYWETLGSLAAASDPKTQRVVIQGILQTLETRGAPVMEAAGPLADFFLHCSNSNDYQLKQDALEFWPVSHLSPPLCLLRMLLLSPAAVYRCCCCCCCYGS